jgi:hypothetical protein
LQAIIATARMPDASAVQIVSAGRSFMAAS